MRENYTLKRLYYEGALSEGAEVSLAREAVHYLSTVLRMSAGDCLRLFNGRDGEWLCELVTLSKKKALLVIKEPLREPVSMPNVRLAFAPVRKHRTAFIFEKGTELGVSHFEPVITARTQYPKLNLDKARSQIIEAAEQTERLDIPDVSKPQRLLDWLGLQSGRTILFADEAGDAQTARDVIQKADEPVTLLIGPEGGFTDEERQALKQHGDVKSLSLGPRILRADTAALSLLSLWQAVKGDWR